MLGEYTYSAPIESWYQQRSDPDGGVLMLCGRGRCPSEEQVILWSGIEERLSGLTHSAVVAASALLTGRERGAFDPRALVLDEVRIELDNSFALFLSLPRNQEMEMWPMVKFNGWEPGLAEWVV